MRITSLHNAKGSLNVRCSLRGRKADEYLDAYIAAVNIDDAVAPLFQSLDEAHRLTGEAISRRDMLRMVKERCKSAGLADTFKATVLNADLADSTKLVDGHAAFFAAEIYKTFLHCAAN